ncbi:MAG: histidinol dehydrogenase [Anaerolineae bacterium]|nr:histidinol dehydrogenase [Anaerolineae bacterium]MCB9103981.1 histidinol dehydrogenase [Anaerolineales bacterium]
MAADLFRLFDAAEARQTLLRRAPVGDVSITPSLAKGLERVFGEVVALEEAVRRILADVRGRGDAAVLDWTEKIDGVRLQALAVDPADIETAYAQIPSDLRDALHFAADRIRTFHQKQPAQSWLDWQASGGALGQMVRPLERVGVYAPGGTAPYPSTLLMCAVTARVAGVEQVIVATPSGREDKIAPVLLAAAKVAGVDAVYRIGGAQAVAAMAYGTESLPKVDKIVGPGNIFVTLAKRQVFGQVDIDGLPGPTETLVIADEAANPAVVAADLLAQAEHDTLASAILVTPSRALAEAVQVEIGRQVENLSRAEIIVESLQNQGGAVICADLAEAVELSNLYAPEHLCLHVGDPWALTGQVKNAGGVFLGEHAYEVLGDYTAGPTHVMPTMGTARFASPLSVRDFTKIISVFGLDAAEAARIGPAAQRLAEAEGLDAHATAVRKRLGD